MVTLWCRGGRVPPALPFELGLSLFPNPFHLAHHLRPPSKKSKKSFVPLDRRFSSPHSTLVPVCSSVVYVLPPTVPKQGLPRPHPLKLLPYLSLYCWRPARRLVCVFSFSLYLGPSVDLGQSPDVWGVRPTTECILCLSR